MPAILSNPDALRAVGRLSEKEKSGDVEFAKNIAAVMKAMGEMNSDQVKAIAELVTRLQQNQIESYVAAMQEVQKQTALIAQALQRRRERWTVNVTARDAKGLLQTMTLDRG